MNLEITCRSHDSVLCLHERSISTNLFCALHIDSGWKHCNNVPEKRLGAKTTSDRTGREKTMHHFVHQCTLTKQNLLLKTEWPLWLSLPIKVHKPKAERYLVQNYKNLNLIKRIKSSQVQLPRESSVEMENFLNIILLFIIHSMNLNSSGPFQFLCESHGHKILMHFRKTISEELTRRSLSTIDEMIYINCLLTWMHGSLGKPVIER